MRIVQPMTRANGPIDYLDPKLPPGLRPGAGARRRRHRPDPAGLRAPRRRPGDCVIEIVRWPAQGTRPVDPDTGDQGGTTEGVFVSEWERRHPVRAQRGRRGPLHPRLRGATGAGAPRTRASRRGACCSGTRTTTPTADSSSSRWTKRPFYVPLALPGDDVTPERFVCFRFDGRHGLYIHPNIWHEGVFVARRQAALLRQAGRGARARLGGLRARVRMPARGAPGSRGHRVRKV